MLDIIDPTQELTWENLVWWWYADAYFIYLGVPAPLSVNMREFCRA